MHPSPTSSVRAGFALVTALSLLAVLGLLLGAYFLTTTIELTASSASRDGTTGFYSAEAGLNLRGEEIRQRFHNFNVPRGTSPSETAPCEGANTGTGDFACRTQVLNERDVVTYVVEDPANAGGGVLVNIPMTERFGGLNAFESRYSVFSRAIGPRSDRPEAILEMVFRSRVVPIFQFAAFYNKDLEILPGANMTLNGRVHANGDLYLNAESRVDLAITGQVTVAQRADGRGGDLYRRRKNSSACGGTVRINDVDPSTRPEPSVDCRGRIPQSVLDAWNGQVQTGLDTLEVPPAATFEPGGEYWDKADLRIALDLTGGAPRIIVPRMGLGAGGAILADAARTSALGSCAPADPGASSRRAYAAATATLGPVEASQEMYNQREGRTIRMLEIDMEALLDCLHDQAGSLLGFGRGIDDATEGGLVLFLTVVGPSSASINDYGVRVRNGDRLASTRAAAPDVRGVTVATDQAIYVQGDYNVDAGGNWRPASFLADSLNVLSNAWSDANSSRGLGNRRAANTQINAAFLAGTDTTADREGTAGQDRGDYNGGLENYPRFHEDWGGRTLTYRGSFVSLDNPRHVDGSWGSQSYGAPQRNWSYDERFNNPATLPPLSPRFVYLRQELFVRDFEQ